MMKSAHTLHSCREGQLDVLISKANELADRQLKVTLQRLAANLAVTYLKPCEEQR
jgi:hypothetical protein